MKKLYPIKMTKKNKDFLLTAVDFIGDKQTRMLAKAKIISRLSAMGCFGYKWMTPKEKEAKGKKPLDRFYSLYREGRVKDKAPQGFIDYFKAAKFVLDEIEVAKKQE